MNQSNLDNNLNNLNNSVNQLKGLLSFLTPSTTFIVNAAFAIVAFVLYILQDAGYSNFVSFMFNYAGGILGFLVLLGLTAGAIALPLKKKRLSMCLNTFIIGFMLLSCMLFMHWGIITILLVVLILFPWLLFSLLMNGEEVKL